MRRLLFTCCFALAATGCGLVLNGSSPTPDAAVPDSGMGDGAVVDGSMVDADPLDADPLDTGPPAECETLDDCFTALGDPVCGTWACAAGACQLACDCNDGDGDGYGVGTECLGGDCDDGDPSITDFAFVDCYDGPGDTLDVGSCRAGVAACFDGLFDVCQGQVMPMGEACNGADDDCNGATDDLPAIVCGLGACATTVRACSSTGPATCARPAVGVADGCGGGDTDCDGAVDEDCATGGCVYVSPFGVDSSTAPTNASSPLRTIREAIRRADSDPALPRRVCVASSSCSAPTIYPENVDMRDGISVYGGFEATRFAPCPGRPMVVIRPEGDEGVTFDSGVRSPTVLANVRIERSGGSIASGVTMSGANGAVLAGVEIDGGSDGPEESYGVVLDGAVATITGSSIWSGRGRSLSVGVWAARSKPTIIDNCDRRDAAGRCSQFCRADSGQGIRGKVRAETTTGESYAILLEDSPGALVSGSATCGQRAGDAAQILVNGDAAGTVITGNVISGWGGDQTSHGIQFEDCDGAAPRVVGNYDIQSEGRRHDTLSDAVHVEGDCHPVIEGNRRLVSALEGQGVVSGVHCTGGSQCFIANNALIQGAALGMPDDSAGVRCDADSCARISGNVIRGQGGLVVRGVLLEGTGALVDRNRIEGGCARTFAAGLESSDAWSRIENNEIVGGYCGDTISTGAVYFGLKSLWSVDSAGPDVHSNTIVGHGAFSSCVATGLFLETTGGSVGPNGTYRNNIIVGGVCPNTFGVDEATDDADPIAFRHNDIDMTRASTLYRDGAGGALTSAAAIDALTDAFVGGNIDGAPGFVSYPVDLRIVAGSVCENAGTDEGAPTMDLEGDARDAVSPDIGADER